MVTVALCNVSAVTSPTGHHNRTFPLTGTRYYYWIKGVQLCVCVCVKTLGMWVYARECNIFERCTVETRALTQRYGCVKA